MSEVAHDGRTVLLVSHSMAAIQAMSDDVVVLDRGRLVHRGPPADAVSAYLDRLEGADAGLTTSDLRAMHRQNPGESGFVEGFLNGRPLASRHTARAGEDLAIDLVVDLPEARRNCFVGVNIDDEFGVRVWSLHSRWHVPRFDLGPGAHRVRCVAERPPLVPGHYYIGLELVAGHERLDTIERVASLHFVEADLFATGETPHRDHGYVASPARWTVEKTHALDTVAVSRP
jgi:hypothetical protein